MNVFQSYTFHCQKHTYFQRISIARYIGDTLYLCIYIFGRWNSFKSIKYPFPKGVVSISFWKSIHIHVNLQDKITYTTNYLKPGETCKQPFAGVDELIWRGVVSSRSIWSFSVWRDVNRVVDSVTAYV